MGTTNKRLSARYILGPLVVMVVASFGHTASAQRVGEMTTRCDIGFLYEISYQESWGDSYATVAEVFPGSPAEKAGLQYGDIIYSIDGRNTRTINEETLTNLLLDPTKGTIELVVGRLGTPEKRVTLYKKCVPARALSESQLAASFNFYSLEDVTDRRFTMPFTYSLPSKEDFMSYKTFTFGKQQLDGVEQEIAKALVSKGLKQVATSGDLIVQVRHALEQNPSYRPGEAEDLNNNLRNYRANATSAEIQDYPFLSINSPSFSGTHRLVIEVDLLKAQTHEKVWGVVARERLNEQYSAVEYARAFAPLMMSNFPMLRYVMNPVFVLHKNSFRYTGIYYDSTDLQRVIWVDKGSPADKVGIREGDRIVAINGLPLSGSVAELTEAYKSFIASTWQYRNPETIYPSDSGFRRNMYWSVDKYLSVAEAIQKPENKAVFSYLFSHRTYINSPIIKELVFEIERGDEEIALLVTPELRNLDYLTQK